VVVVDASAGAEIVAKTARGERLATLVPRGARRDIPDHFTVETAGVLRRWELSGKLTRDQAAAALSRLVRWPGYRYPLTPLLEEAWTYRHNLMIADALYVVLALRLNADLITGDLRLANAPNLPPGLNVVTLPSVV
jgi:predicted nucleic acid-binding protein